jgi:hypothetical protein
VYTLRDLLVCGPVILALALCREMDWQVLLAIGLVVYAAMRGFAALIGLEQAVRDRHGEKVAAAMAIHAERGDGRTPPRLKAAAPHEES